MSISISRRQFTAIMASVPLAVTSRSGAIAAQHTSDARIGATQDAFDAHFGEPRTDDWFTVYDFSDEGEASYWVAWDANGHAHRIGIDYSAIEGGGLPYDPGLLGQSQFLPNDAVINLAGFTTNLQIGETGFYVAQHLSDEVQTETGRSGNILVVDEKMTPGDGPNNNPNFTRTSVAMEAFEVNAIDPLGSLPGISSPMSEWEAEFGEIVAPQRGMMIQNPPIPGRWMFNDQMIDVILDEPIRTVEAAMWVSDFLPGDLPEMSTTYWLPAPGDEVGLRISTWEIENGMSYVALQVVNGGEEAGTVDRFGISIIAPAVV